MIDTGRYWITLGDLIDRFGAAYESDDVIPCGLANPHSYRGFYHDLAFEPADNVRVGDMLAMLSGCVGETFEGWKGGDYMMSRDSTCYIAYEGFSGGDMIGPVLLHFLTHQTPVTAGGGE